MNIFFVDVDPQACAESHLDKHVIKMILEYAQILSTAHRVLDSSDDPVLYKATHVNHPSTKWARASKAHYAWLFGLFEACCAEYTRRYGKVHATQRRLLDVLRSPPKNLAHHGWTNPPCAMPDEFKTGNCVASYRSYYASKARIASWKSPATPPAWW